MTTTNEIVFFGTPDFAARVLEYLLDEGFTVRGVVTAPDRPAGRGRRPQAPPVKEVALAHGLPVLQPERLKDPAFLEALHSWHPALQVVVAFRMLPREVWQLPPYGTFNLHASLLPQYRGAAPIQHVLLNGEKETGVTTFLIDEQIDTGKILFQEKVPILPDDDAGTLTGRLLKAGAPLVARTITALLAGEAQPVEQPRDPGELKKAPKITADDLWLDWSQPPAALHNRIRAFSPVPGARTRLRDRSGKELMFKIFRATPREGSHTHPVPSLVSDGKTYLDVAVPGGYLRLEEVQLEGRKKMGIKDFLRGTDPTALTFAV